MDASPPSLLDPPEPIHAFTAVSPGHGLNRAPAALVADAAAAGTLEPTRYLNQPSTRYRHQGSSTRLAQPR